MEQLIIKALKSACGNRHFKFQVVVGDDQLHVYVNYRPNYQPNQSILEENVGAAIASLNLDGIESVWLYGRPLSQTEPEWQIFVELPTQASTMEDTEASGNNISDTDIDSQKDSVATDAEPKASLLDCTSSAHKDSFQSGINEIYSDLNDGIESDEFSDLTDFADFDESNSAMDTGLLHDAGLVHGGLLEEAEIDTFTALIVNDDSELPPNADTNSNSLIQYCFVTNKKLLTDTAPDPDKNIIRMVKFLHHLSESDRHQLLPILASYFRGGITPGLEKIPAIQNWFEQLKALDEDKQRTFFIWLSRYCFDPTTTLNEFQAITAPHAAEIDNRSKCSTEYSLVNVKSDVSTSSVDEDPVNEPSQMPPIVRKTLVPGLWSLATIILILLGIMNHNSNIVVGTAQVPPLCNNSIGSKEYCRLAVNLAGEDAIAQAKTSLFPMTEVTETVADYGCARYTNLKAGIEIANIAPETTPVISSRGEKIFPHIYVIQTEQKHAKRAGNIKIGCVYTTGQGQRSPKKLAADLIPIDWPAQYYQKQSGEDNISFGIYANPINLGLYTIFAALGIALSSWLNLSLKINRTHTIYLVALMLGIVQLTISLLPSFGLLGAIVIPILTILAASFLFKDFKLNWSRGYASVAVSVLVIIAVQFSLYSLCLGMIGSLL